ncbi:YwgA family protein [Desulforamulus hydrothermalis]|uniref:PadR family transcriptional regulator n=1 Tax=Desulforamulus hydrothermalis Lam5 = DSM 18033 TaxID=1121428 RepID=K8E7Z0_9FIRM|nr:hypothetical protein [Desulforamulus hydrothermalis]CCO07623.1 conserved hypothetical protein [Desulforamulus hydrothermalis Lam5 = DSM 18033]SHH19673.1 hypothetical protein SAMN02745177_01780 [Desulforamulus hydrothermalis Lam5 = DSM 18033]
MFDAAFKLLNLFSQVGEIHGRKKLQKMVHLLKKGGVAFPFKYEYHHYGPYSAQLQSEINSLVYNGFLAEKKENDTYVYSLTDQGRRFKEKLAECLHYQFEIKKTLVNLLAEKNSQFLEMVSTFAFLIDAGYDAAAAKEKCLELKPHLQKHIDEAIAFYEKNFLQ